MGERKRTVFTVVVLFATTCIFVVMKLNSIQVLQTTLYIDKKKPPPFKPRKSFYTATTTAPLPLSNAKANMADLDKQDNLKKSNKSYNLANFNKQDRFKALAKLKNQTRFLIGDRLKIRSTFPPFLAKKNRLVDCRKLFEGSETERQFARKITKKKALSPKDYMELTKNCTHFLQSRQYIVEPLSTEEAQFPIAYSILTYKDIEQTERLLRAIYRPQNYYCIHVDKKSLFMQEAMDSIVNCFPNVFLASESYRVSWGEYSVLEPELRCMKDLWNYKNWRYFINLTGQEFPLKTNLEIVKILKIFNGANNVEGSVKRLIRHRLWMKKPPEYNVTFTYGAVHVVVQRGFVDYLLHNKTAIHFTKWLNGTWIPDETLFTSLNYSPQLGVPGSYKGEPESEPADVINGTYPRNPFLARFKNWKDRNHPVTWPCNGTRARDICVFGVGDLPLLASRKELFANKFGAYFQPKAYDCLEERHFNRTKEQLLPDYKFDDTYYKNLEFIHNVVH